MKALVTHRGTAAAETALCDECHSKLENRVKAEGWAGADVQPGSWTDCSGNDALECQVCGRECDAPVYPGICGNSLPCVDHLDTLTDS